MPKVIVFDLGMSKGIVAEGETDGKVFDEHYVKVNGELYHYGCVIRDTSEARCAVELVVKATKAAEDARSYANLLGARFLRCYKL